MSDTFKAWIPLPEAERPGKDDELVGGTLAEVLDRARRRAERKGIKQRVRCWARSYTLAGASSRFGYYAIQDIDG